MILKSKLNNNNPHSGDIVSQNCKTKMITPKFCAIGDMLTNIARHLNNNNKIAIITALHIRSYISAYRYCIDNRTRTPITTCTLQSAS